MLALVRILQIRNNPNIKGAKLYLISGSAVLFILLILLILMLSLFIINLSLCLCT
jgi:hypothetical protein